MFMITSGCRDTLTLPEELDNTRLSIADSIILFLLKHTRQLALPISSFDLVANSYENLIKAHNNTIFQLTLISLQLIAF